MILLIIIPFLLGSLRGGEPREINTVRTVNVKIK